MPVSHESQNIKVAVDAVIFTIRDNELKVLLIQMKKKPYEGAWAFPGGLIDTKETSEEAARRILEEQTGVKQVYLEQLATFDDLSRDPLGRVMSVAYMALIASQDLKLRTTEKYQAVQWLPIGKLPMLAYDHKEIAKTALERLRGKLSYSNIVWSLLPAEFTLTDLQRVYEIILGQSMDKRNFRRKILSLGLVKPTGKKQTGKSFRPADLFKFKDRHLVYVDIL